MYRKIFAVLVGSLTSIALSNAGPLDANRTVKGVLEVNEDQKGDGWEFKINRDEHNTQETSIGTLTFEKEFNGTPLILVTPYRYDSNFNVLKASPKEIKLNLRVTRGAFKDKRDRGSETSMLFSFMAIEQ